MVTLIDWVEYNVPSACLRLYDITIYKPAQKCNVISGEHVTHLLVFSVRKPYRPMSQLLGEIMRQIWLASTDFNHESVEPIQKATYIC